MPYDVSEIYTAGVREVLPRLQARKLAFAFDCRGPQLTLPGDPQALRRGLHRLLCALVEMIEVGFLFFDAETGRAPAGEGLVRLKLAGTGLRADGAATAALLRRLELSVTPPAPGDPRGSHRAAGRCPCTGARIEFASLPKDGVLFSLELVEPGAECWEVVRAPDAGGTPAWLVNENAVGARSLARRLQRLGWTPEIFASAAQAQQALASARARPGLLVVVEPDSPQPDGLVALDRLLPAGALRVHAVAPGSPVLAAPAVGGFTQAIYPLSPWELHELTARHCRHRETPCMQVLPEPMLPQERPRLLVVDDNPLTRLIARDLVEALGYEVATAADGAAALATCAAWSPDAVLMDVHMSPLDGPATTRRLRQLQLEGRVAPCAVVAATADDSEATRRACAEAGMDGRLAKPLTLTALAAELQRVCAGHGREGGPALLPLATAPDATAPPAGASIPGLQRASVPG